MVDAVDQVCADTAPRQRSSFSASGRRAVYRIGLFIFCYYLFLAYPLMRMASASFPDWRPGTPELLVLFVLPALGRLFYHFFPGQASRAVLQVTMTWVGVSCMGFCVVVVGEVIGLLVPIPSVYWGAGLLAITGTLCAYAFWNAHRLHVKEVTVQVANVKCQAKDLAQRVCQISDVHVGSRGVGHLRRVVERVNACAPDVVMITGDLIDVRNVSIDELRVLSEIEAPTFYCTGNHERYVDLEAIDARLRELGIFVLRNEAKTFGDLQIIGIDDADARDQVGRVLPSIEVDSSRYVVLLYHRPDGLEDAAAAGVDLMLCGHTHNGQVIPFNWLVKRVFPRIQGVYRTGATTLHVSPGTGTWGPILRLGSRNEISMFRFESSS